MFNHYFVVNSLGDTLECMRGGARHFLFSYAYMKKGIPDEIIAKLKKGTIHCMIDSGAFTNLYRPGSVTLDGYCEWLQEHRKLCDQYVMMDVIGDRNKTIANYDKMRDRGLDPVFVDHVWLRESKALEPFYKSGKTVGWGGMVGNPQNKKVVGIPPELRKRVETRGLLAGSAPRSKLHLLGVGLRVYYFLGLMPMVKSIDSTSWVNGRKYAALPLIVRNEQNWPRFRFLHKDTPEWQEQARKMRGANYDPSNHHDRVAYVIRAMVHYFSVFQKRVSQALQNKEPMNYEVSKGEEDHLFFYDPEPVRHVVKAALAKRNTGEIRPGSDSEADPIQVADVLSQYEKPIFLRAPAVSLVGSLPVNGETKGDIDLLVHGPLDEATRRVIEFRLGRALPPGLSKRVQFHDESLGGPFTDFANVYDLALVPRSDSRKIVQMQEKSDDPMLDWPEKTGKRDAVVQIHTRGASAHFDLRFKVNNHLVGWTAFAQVAGEVDDIETVSQARQLYSGYSPDKGNRYLKPVLAPAKLQVGGKLRQPVDWLDVEGEVLGEGEIGATAREKGVIVAVARPKVEWGLQLPHFHEYFLSGDQVWKGPLYVRFLVGRGDPGGGQATEDSPADRPFWTMWLSRSALPSVLDSRAVKKGHMPPLGQSAMPATLMEVTPPEFHFWKAKTDEEARRIRDELVASEFFTEENTRIVDGQFRRVVTKHYLYQANEKAESKDVRYTLSWVFWRGPMVSRTGPSRQVWLLMFDDGTQGLKGFELQNDPREESPVTALERSWNGKGLLAADQNLKPGEAIDGNVLNQTKATPAWIRRQEHGIARLSRGADGELLLGITEGRMTGLWVATPEEQGSEIWVLQRASEKTTKALAPGDRFRPMKPRGGANVGEFSEVAVAVKNWALKALSEKVPIVVEPKWNGYRAIAGRKKDGAAFLWFEDSKDDRTKILPSLAKTLAGVPGEFTLDSELLDHGADGKVLPRASLARFTGNVDPQDDSRTMLHTFRLMYWDRAGGDLMGQTEAENRPVLRRFIAFAEEHGAKGRLVVTEARLAKDVDSLVSAIQWARKVEGSEGAMLKRLDAKYSLAGESGAWAKIKTIRRVNALVVHRERVAGSENTWVYVCAVGPISSDAGFAENESIKVNGTPYAIIGRTGNTNVQAEPGQIIQASFFELKVDKKPGARRIRWFGPPRVELLRDDLKKPTTVEEVEAMATTTEVRKTLEDQGVSRISLLKTEEERYVLGIVLEPTDGTQGAEYKPDSQKDIYSKAEVRQAAHRFMEEFRNIGLMHRTLVNGKVKILESFVVPDGTGGFDMKDPEGQKQHVQEGTWLLGLRVADNELWEQVKSGSLSGLSIGGSARRVNPGS